MQLQSDYANPVFISYAHNDVHRAAELAELLEEAGVPVWWDRALRLGEAWREEIERNLDEASRVVVLWTKQSRDSAFVRDEANRAQRQNKLVQLVLDTGEVPIGFGEVQWRRAAELKEIMPEMLISLGRSSVLSASTRSFNTERIKVHLSSLPTTTAKLFGREIEMTRLLNAWETRKTNVFSIIGMGGSGKTALIRHFLNHIQNADWVGATDVYAWSAYAQGTGENRNASAAEFIVRALSWFGYRGADIQNEFDRGTKLAEIIGSRRALLIVDGIESLQELPGQDTVSGRIRDKGLRALLSGLADQNQGLCIVASQQDIVELKDRSAPAVRMTDLSHLDERSSVLLLESFGVRGDERVLAEATKAAGGHALTLNLLGSYIAGVHSGRISEAKAAIDDLVRHGGTSGDDRAVQMMEHYVRKLEPLSENTNSANAANSELALLQLVGLFSRPADSHAIKALCQAGLEAPLAVISTMSPQRWALAVARLRGMRLLLPRDPANPDRIDAHPLVKAYFRKHLSEEWPDVFRSANMALYEHYKYLGLPISLRTKEVYGLFSYSAIFPEISGDEIATAERIIAGQFLDGEQEILPPGLLQPDADQLREAVGLLCSDFGDDVFSAFLPSDIGSMGALSAAISHGVAAGEAKLAFEEIYWPRVNRGNRQFIKYELGAPGLDLTLLGHFFAKPWSEPTSALSRRDTVLLLSNAGYSLAALGRLRDAEHVTAAALTLLKQGGSNDLAATVASNLGELRLTLGDISGAIAAGREGTYFAEQESDESAIVECQTLCGYALHQAGKTDQSSQLFRDCEAMHAKNQPNAPWLYGTPGFRYCDLLLSKGSTAEVKDRAECAIRVAEAEGLPPINIALDRISLGRALLSMGAVESKDKHSAAFRSFDDAVAMLRQSGEEDELPLGLLARAACLREMGEFTQACRDLREVRSIAERGSMRLYLVDWHLECARLLVAQLPIPVVTTKLLGFRKIIKPPTLSLEQREIHRQATEHVDSARELIRLTRYHLRDADVLDLGKRLDFS